MNYDLRELAVLNRLCDASSTIIQQAHVACLTNTLFNITTNGDRRRKNPRVLFKCSLKEMIEQGESVQTYALLSKPLSKLHSMTVGQIAFKRAALFRYSAQFGRQLGGSRTPEGLSIPLEGLALYSVGTLNLSAIHLTHIRSRVVCRRQGEDSQWAGFNISVVLRITNCRFYHRRRRRILPQLCLPDTIAVF